MPSPTIVLLPMWAPGHFSSMLEAGKRLLLCSPGGTAAAAPSLTVLVTPPPMPASSQANSIQAHCEMMAAAGIVFHRLPAIEHRTDLVLHPSEYIRRYAPHVKAAIAGSAAPVAAVVVDFFGTPLLDVAHDLAVPAYVYFASTGAMLALMLRLPAIRQEELKLTMTASSWLPEEGGGVIDVPGMPPVPVASLPSPDVNDYAWFAYYGRRFLEARGIIVNTAAELEPGVLASIGGGRCAPAGGRAPRVYPIGPVLSPKPPPPPRVDARSSSAQDCIRWLDAQPPASVVFLCFGSMGWMDAEQAREVATGLERSEHRFLWVLRGPPAASSQYPTDADLGDDGLLLPQGFLERTKAKGLVCPSWAPQPDILAHAAVGGFVTHCGWNSVLESLWHGVPMAAWPLYAEQPLNAFELVACMGVAVELRDRTGSRDHFVEATELERAIRSLMGGSEEGRKAKEKARKMKAACREAVEKGGSAYAAMQALVQDMLESHVPAAPNDPNNNPVEVKWRSNMN